MKIKIDCVQFKRYNPYEYKKITEDRHYKGEKKWDAKVKKVEVNKYVVNR